MIMIVYINEYTKGNNKATRSGTEEITANTLKK